MTDETDPSLLVEPETPPVEAVAEPLPADATSPEPDAPAPAPEPELVAAAVALVLPESERPKPGPDASPDDAQAAKLQKLERYLIEEIPADAPAEDDEFDEVVEQVVVRKRRKRLDG